MPTIPIHNYNARVIHVPVRLGALRDGWYPKQLPVQESWRQRYAAGRFAKIKATDGQHITLREKDDATIAYLVPSAGIDGLVDLNELARMIEELPPVSHSRGCDGVEARGVDDVRFYCVWNPMTPGLEPLESCNFRRDGASAEEFVNAAKPLWDYADESDEKCLRRLLSILCAISVAGLFTAKSRTMDGNGHQSWNDRTCLLQRASRRAECYVWS